MIPGWGTKGPHAARELAHAQSCPTLCQAPLSTGLSWQEYWSGLSFPPPGDIPHPGIKLISPTAPALAGGFFTTEPPGKLMMYSTAKKLGGHTGPLQCTLKTHPCIGFLPSLFHLTGTQCFVSGSAFREPKMQKLGLEF